MPVLQPPSFVPSSLGRRIALSRAILAWETLWPRLMAPLAFLALFLAAAHFEIFRGLAPWPHVGVIVGMAMGLVGVTWLALRGVVWPDRDAAE